VCSTSSASGIRVTRSPRGGEVHPELEALLALQEKDEAVTATEDAIAALEPELSALDAALAAAERALEAAQAQIRAALDRREALAGRREQIAAQRERALAQRERAAAQVGARSLARYERIRRGKAPLALYPLHGDACGNCFTAVPTQRRALIQRGASIEGCEA